MKTIIGVALGALIVSACTAPSNDRALREYDLRKEQYQYVNTDIYMDLPTVQRQLYIHREACDVKVELKKDPMQVHFATLYYSSPEATQLKDQVMLDLTAYATGKLAIKGYAYYSANKDLARSVVNVLSEPTLCPESIGPNLTPNPYVNMAPDSTADKEAKKE